MSLKFGLMSQIDAKDKRTWVNRFFLTFDIDWAHDAIIQDCYDLISKYQVNSTWFCTHKCAFNTLNDQRLELGIHPNFNGLFDHSSKLNANDIIENCLSFVPEAKVVRSHSLVQSERLVDRFAAFGLTHVSNFYLPFEAHPFELWSDITIVPHIFQDNVSIKLSQSFDNLIQTPGFKVFNFHPIHVFLNTECLPRYENTREIHHIPGELVKHRFSGYGTRTKLIQLLEGSRV